jgi:hypothetical protein
MYPTWYWAVEVALRNAVACGMPAERCAAYCGDMFSAVPHNSERFDVILFNPPQSGGPPGFSKARPDKYGGDDGSWFYVELAKSCRPFMAQGCRVLVSQHGLANPNRVHEAFQANGFRMAVLAEQERQLSKDSLDAIFPGLFRYQLAQVARGQAEILSWPREGGAESSENGRGKVRATGGAMQSEKPGSSPDKNGEEAGLGCPCRGREDGEVEEERVVESEWWGAESIATWQRVFLLTDCGESGGG